MMLRFSRQLGVLGEAGQKRLRSLRVLVGGAGGIGSSALYYLAAAGVGTIIIVDRDKVSLPDLNRQILYTSEDLGRWKVEVVVERLKSLNPDIEVIPLNLQLDEYRAIKLASGVDVIVDCFDNWEARFALNKAAVEHVKPLVHAAVEEMYGLVTSIYPGRTPCLRCIYPRPKEKPGPLQVVGGIAGAIGALEALEVVKIATGVGTPLYGRMFYLDMKSGIAEVFKVERNPNCAICGHL